MNQQIQLPDLSVACRPPGYRHARGVTLIELLITVVIVAILASIAIPSYSSYVLRSHRTEAKTALLDMAAMEERFYSTQNQYSVLPTQLGYAGGAFPINVGNNYYQINVINVALPTPTTPATYTLVATPINMQVGDTACTSFSVDQSGTQIATGSPTATVDCWK
jgi:type IV pilus assembly protein PilE